MGKLFRSVLLKNGRKTIYIVAFIDSGSDTTIISERIANELGVVTTKGGGILLPDGRKIPSEVGEIEIKVPRDGIKKKWIVDITDIPFNEDIDDVDMIIGVDLLQECNIKIHFQGNSRPAGSRGSKAGKGPVWHAPADAVSKSR